jgi:uncharacterized membrane protein HdeD (DUF308 family)
VSSAASIVVGVFIIIVPLDAIPGTTTRVMLGIAMTAAGITGFIYNMRAFTKNK